MKPELFIGALSGTSIDGIDVALVRFDPQPALVASHSLPYPEELRRELLALGTPGENEIDRLGRADVLAGRCFAQAVNELLAKAALPPEAVGAVGSHGQTIRHRPAGPAAFTLQIGDPNVIAALTGIPVVADFRRKDMALGGQGAPLVPAFHEAVFRAAGQDRVVVNIGGIANLTVLPGRADAPIAGFDTGPGNTLMDAWSRRVLQQPMDRDGALAARGRLAPALLAALLADPYFKKTPPKSTGPEYFSPAWLERHLTAAGSVADADVQATLLALTAQTIATAIRQAAGTDAPGVFVCGGGANNPALMAALRGLLPRAAVDRTDALGVAAGWVEAMAFAWLARQRWHAQPGNSPVVTGAQRPAVLGGLFLPE
ncbi:anhydro-N-acetylmuramic acid kinase [Opitutus sp. GAS368]|uniref:anhydro-N-acetylmuramic acid kinase n=1 Tax=Opitutus sp. GAS368 TaxID=1882749 RepID=UPI00087BC843|nr:anhydro-N-acetylmuramic acid kinase [Opitutus sp. GAS368]SDS31662.1 anhydro-N-acetylmuramic acid kinase [Opitutus sp. GAS368]